jgi:hypothetical protein
VEPEDAASTAQSALPAMQMLPLLLQPLLGHFQTLLLLPLLLLTL